MGAAVRAFAAGVPAEDVAFDLTPGYKSLSLELAELAPAGSWLLYCRHQQLAPDYRVDPGTERYDCWRRLPEAPAGPLTAAVPGSSISEAGLAP
jgi:hypothetical protein